LNLEYQKQQCKITRKWTLGWKSIYWPTFIHKWSTNDHLRIYMCCECFLHIFTITPKNGKVIFSDKCAIYQSSTKINVYMWSKNSYYHEEPPHFNMVRSVSNTCFWTVFFIVQRTSNIILQCYESG
jgi:hypothetical protein